VLIAILTLMGVGGIVDIVLDGRERLMTPHMLFELLMILLGLGVALYLWRAWSTTRGELYRTRAALAEQAAARAEWRQRASRLLADFGRAIDEQFREWKLTPSEREVAFLMLRGLSHKEIAHQTSRSERTVRQHAVAVYRKAGLSGRAALAGFFLGDLSMPAA
jgi:DNA-binding NarL/FixJ family response regulator